MGLICDHHTLSGGGAGERIRPRSYIPRALGARGLYPCRERWELAACTFYIGKRGGGRVCDPARVNHASDPKGSRFPNQSGDRVLNVDLGTAAVASRSQVSTR